MELINIYDMHNKKIIGSDNRQNIHNKKLWHREVEVILINEKNEVLLQKRASTKQLSPNKLGFCGGHVAAFETEKVAAVRETNEETSAGIKEEDLIYLDTYVNDTKNNKSFRYIYIAKTNKKITEFVIQKEELSKLIYIPYLKLKEDVLNKNLNYTITIKPYLNEVLKKIDKALEI